MSTPNPLLQAAAPALITSIQSIQQFVADMGPDPSKWVINYPGAKLKLLGNLALQVPALATAEGGAIEGLVDNQLNSWVTKLQALQAPVTSVSATSVK